MKTLLFFILSLCCFTAHGRNFPYPKIPATATTITGFVPQNWFLKDSAKGDLNGDKIPDCAFVLEYKDTVIELRPNSSVNQGSPRLLVVAFGSAEGYKLFLQNNTFIVRYGEGGMDPEAYGNLSISKGILQVSVSFLRGHLNYKFRLQNGDFYLIGASNGGVDKDIFYYFEANFSTGWAKTEEGRIDENRTKTRWLKLPHKPLRKLRDLKMMLDWEVVKGQYL